MSKNDKFIPHYALPRLFSKDKHVNEEPSIYKDPEAMEKGAKKIHERLVLEIRS
jgi:hypothetical protein